MYRSAFVVCLAIIPLVAAAQQPPAPQERVITRDQYVQRAADMAGRRFDEIDASHTGAISRDQLRAWRQAHGARGGAAPGSVE